MAENGGGVQWRTRLQIEGRARGGAHVEHLLHARDAGGVEAQRLVERRRVLPRVEWRAYDAGGRCSPGGGRRRATVVQAGCREGSTADSGRARGGAHVEHVLHVCDAGGVEAQRLVERRRVLPRVERRAYGVVRGAEYREAR
eukprot:scaffold50376_cov38-Phaeocystis_antarctica.AAC.1